MDQEAAKVSGTLADHAYSKKKKSTFKAKLQTETRIKASSSNVNVSNQVDILSRRDANKEYT